MLLSLSSRIPSSRRNPSLQLSSPRIPPEPTTAVGFSSTNDRAAPRRRISSSETHLISPSSISSSSKRSRKTVCLFFCEETRALAERIASENDAIELRSVNWRFTNISFSKALEKPLQTFFVKFFRTFEDGFPNLFISNAQGIRGQHVAFLASFSSPSVIFEQLSVIYALPRLFISSFTVVLPFFPTGTSERMEEEGDIATAFTLARILSNIPISRGGPTSLVIYDIHALQVIFVDIYLVINSEKVMSYAACSSGKILFWR